MTNFRLFQTEGVCRGFKFDENRRKLSKRVENTVGKGEIARYEQFLLFPQCFQKACFPGASKGVIVWEWVNPFPNKPLFLTGMQYRPFENTVGKGEIPHNEQFLLFPHCFLPFGLGGIDMNIEIVLCKLSQFGRVQNLLFGKV